MQSKCTKCGIKKSRFVKEQKIKGKRFIKQFKNKNTTE